MFGLILSWFISAKTYSIKCFINWILLSISVHSNNNKLCLPIYTKLSFPTNISLSQSLLPMAQFENVFGCKICRK